MLDNLFANTGAKIKLLAKIMFVLECIASVIAGIVFMDGDFDEFYIFLLCVVGGFLAAYLCSLFMAALGDLVQNTIDNRRANEEILARLKETSKI